MAKPYQPKPCRMCGGPKGKDARGRTRACYCAACHRIVMEPYNRNYCTSPDPQHETWNCLECHWIKKRRSQEAAQRGAQTRAKNNPKWRKPANAGRFWQGRAHSAVQAAIKRGLLPSLKGGEYACTDCGNPAHEYDHRDYGRPLDVQPVCRSCNKRRGTACWPEPTTFPRVSTEKVA